ncbi:hypothetical protein [Oscillibacter sp.]|uniref:hypothetical protein n=1 Tax=Oscillibacter sp. TaxID=1945593 RepID=UPI00262E3EDF|nr:hypothetical protein [Oscillibacter sp.]MDD3347807.1 hypothetical protein [Oscillibacter sp.]
MFQKENSRLTAVKQARPCLQRVNAALETALHRYTPRRIAALAMSVYMLLTMLPVSALAAEEGCNHQHDAACYRSELCCGLEESEGHTHVEGCARNNLLSSCYGGRCKTMEETMG